MGSLKIGGFVGRFGLRNHSWGNEITTCSSPELMKWQAMAESPEQNWNFRFIKTAGYHKITDDKNIDAWQPRKIMHLCAEAFNIHINIYSFSRCFLSKLI